MNAIDFVLQGFVLRSGFEAALNKLNPSLLQGMMGASSIAVFVVLDMVLGVLLVYTYAAIRPRFGPGAGTAVKAAVLFWLIGGATWAFTSLMGLFGWGFYFASAACSLVNLLASAYVGAMLYKET